mgnify:CR=1 FL=1
MRDTQRSVSRAVERILESDTILKQCVERGVINLSKVATSLRPAVSRILGYQVSDASIKMALIRYSRKRIQTGSRISELANIIANTNIELRTGVSIAIIRLAFIDKVYREMLKLYKLARFLTVIQGSTGVVVVADTSTINQLLKTIDPEAIISIQRNLAAVTLVSPEEIMTTPGVIAYITSVLAGEGINIIHIESSYTDTIMIIDKKDATKTLNVLSSLIEALKVFTESKEK